MFERYVTWRNKVLSDDEIKNGFPEDAVHACYEQAYDGTPCLIVDLNPEFSPYGMNAPAVRFHNPELPRKADGSLCQPELLKNELFQGGFYLRSALFSDIYKCFDDDANILVGNYHKEKSTFVVCDHGLRTDIGCMVLLTHRRSAGDEKAAKIAAEVAKSALHHSDFPDGEDLICDVFILRNNVGLTRNGKTTKVCVRPEHRIKKLQRDVFQPVFEFHYVDDGVAYSDAWVLDEYGSIVPPSEVYTPHHTRHSGQIKQWNDLRELDVCLYCRVRSNGEVQLYSAQVDFAWKSTQSSIVTELQRRRMYLIRQQIITKLRANQEAYQPILKEPIQSFPEWGELGRI